MRSLVRCRDGGAGCECSLFSGGMAQRDVPELPLLVPC